MQSFLMFFYILDQCYDICQEDDLGGILGAMSPEIWQDGQPIDKAILTDWVKNAHPHTVNEQNIVKKTLDFLNNYEKQLGFDFSGTKKLLSSLSEQTIIKNAVIRTQEMYQKYNYDD